MLHRSLLAVAVALVSATSVAALGDGVSSPTCDAACRSDVLGFLAGRCHRKLPSGCIDDVAAQASSFCSSFLTPTTAVETATALTTSTTTTVATTATDVETTTATSTSTTSTTTTTVFPVFSIAADRRRGAAPTACPKLSAPRLERLAASKASKVSSLCSLLGVTPSAATVTSTTTAVTVETVLSQSTTSTTTTATTTTSTLATETATLDFCATSYREYEGIGRGNFTEESFGVTTGAECCRLCATRSNCAVAVYLSDVYVCQLSIESRQLEGRPTSNMCPFGIRDYTFFPGPGLFYRGPCGSAVP